MRSGLCAPAGEEHRVEEVAEVAARRAGNQVELTAQSAARAPEAAQCAHQIHKNKIKPNQCVFALS